MDIVSSVTGACGVPPTVHEAQAEHGVLARGVCNSQGQDVLEQGQWEIEKIHCGIGEEHLSFVASFV